MKQETKERKRRMREVAPFYRRINDQVDRCFYCDYPRQCLDHVPPLVMVSDYYDIREMKKRDVKLLLLPSCSDCNNYLGMKPLFSIPERLEYLDKRYSKLISQTEGLWSEAEIEELGPGLKSFIESNDQVIRIFANKLSNVQEKLFFLEDKYR